MANSARRFCSVPLNKFSPKWTKPFLKSARVPTVRFDLISDALAFDRLWYGELDAVSNAIGYAKFFISSHAAVIPVYDKAGNVVETREQVGDFETSPPASRATRSGLTFWTSSATRPNWRTSLTQRRR